MGPWVVRDPKVLGFLSSQWLKLGLSSHVVVLVVMWEGGGLWLSAPFRHAPLTPCVLPVGSAIGVWCLCGCTCPAVSRVCGALVRVTSLFGAVHPGMTQGVHKCFDHLEILGGVRFVSSVVGCVCRCVQDSFDVVWLHRALHATRWLLMARGKWPWFGNAGFAHSRAAAISQLPYVYLLTRYSSNWVCSRDNSVRAAARFCVLCPTVRRAKRGSLLCVVVCHVKR